MKRFLILTSFLFLSVASLSAVAKEHPGEKATAEEAAAVKESILAYLENDQELKGGFFLMYDELEDAPIALNFAREFHTVNKVDSGTYFVCADFTDVFDSLFDLDFYVAGQPNDSDPLRVSKIIIHKVNGVERTQ